MFNFEYRRGLAKEIVEEPDKEKRKEILEKEKKTVFYKNADEEREGERKKHKEKFLKLDEELKKTPDELIESGRGSIVAENLEKFKEITPENQKELAKKLIESDQYYAVAKNLEKFTSLTPEDHKELAKKIIRSKSVYMFGDVMMKFEGLDKDIAEMMLSDKMYGPQFVYRHPEKFEGLDRKWLMERELATSHAFNLTQNLENFKEFLDEEVAEKLIDMKSGSNVANHLDYFHGLDLNKIAKKLIENTESFSDGGQSLSQNLGKFSNLESEIAEMLVKCRGGAESIAKNLNSFRILNKNVAEGLVWSNLSFRKVIYENLDKFEGIDQNFIEMYGLDIE